ncbi:site-2 protease family protein [Nocardiopsis sp. MG754419]|uniref:site-2 protease family protein n=1 Tax=Nocardiopsis sp. MG754419 TaxID=2259865 RepID=UPI001BAA6894|nr:site-2 protease family protein [Nocardiopsis sp. MG754419]MBR8744600.1 site-2 protease family protein [Nocardiopsis sp. MG754419]
MPTPEPAPQAESDDATVTGGDGRGPGERARSADPWEQMPEDALNRAGVGADRSGSDDAADATGSEPRDAEKAKDTGSVDADTEDTGTTDTATADTRGWADFLPSPLFVLTLGLAGFAGWLSWRAIELEWAAEGTSVTPLIPPLFILLGWIVSVAVHEFAHALAAYLAGDRSLRGGAYLRLNPFGYRQTFGGLVLPVAYLGLGGFGLNGPPTYVDWDAIPGRGRRAAVALAGPLASLLLSAVLALTVSLLVPAGQDSVNWAISSLAFLAFANMTSALINLLPVPGLDGYHVLAAFQGSKWTAFVAANGLFCSIGVFAVLWLPVVRDLFDTVMYMLFELILPNPTIPGMMFHGKLLLQFWNN